MTHEPTELRFDIPHSARTWNYWLGGKDNYAADREFERIPRERSGIVVAAYALIELHGLLMALRHGRRVFTIYRGQVYPMPINLAAISQFFRAHLRNCVRS